MLGLIMVLKIVVQKPKVVGEMCWRWGRWQLIIVLRPDVRKEDAIKFIQTIKDKIPDKGLKIKIQHLQLKKKIR